MKGYIIETTALRNNLQVCRKTVGDVKIYAVLKGNGYGLGTASMAKQLREEGVTAFAVSEVSEAEAIRNSGLTEEEILMLGPVYEYGDIEKLLDLNVIFTVDSSDTGLKLNSAAEKHATTALAHIKIDVGMGRYGFDYIETDKVKAVYNHMTKIVVQGIYTQFPSAFCDGKATREQFDRFMAVVEELKNEGYEVGCVHCANSSAALRFEYTRLGAVRIGSALLGRLSFKAKNNLGFIKLGYIEADIRAIRWLRKGQTTGYGSVWKAKRPTRAAVLDVGYFHGFGVEKGREKVRFKDFVLGSMSLLKRFITGVKFSVTIGGEKVQVLGRVGMLHTVVDVTGIECKVGDAARMDAPPLMIKGLKRIYR